MDSGAPSTWPAKKSVIIMTDLIIDEIKIVGSPQSSAYTLNLYQAQLCREHGNFYAIIDNKVR